MMDCLEKLKVLLVPTDTPFLSRDIELGIGCGIWELRLLNELKSERAISLFGLTTSIFFDVG